MKHITTYKIFESTHHGVTKEQIEEATETLMYSLIDILDDYKWEYTHAAYLNEDVKSGIKIKDISRDECIDICAKIEKMLPDIKNQIGMNVDFASNNRYALSISDKNTYYINIFIKWQAFWTRLKKDNFITK